jgi:hypothetical protein
MGDFTRNAILANSKFATFGRENKYLCILLAILAYRSISYLATTSERSYIILLDYQFQQNQNPK